MHSYIGFCSLNTTTTKKNQHLNHIFLPLVGFRHSRKKFLPPHFFQGKPNFSKSYTVCLGFKTGVQGFIFLLLYTTDLEITKKKLSICHFSGSDQTPIPGVTKLRFVLTRFPLLVGCANAQQHYCKRIKQNFTAIIRLCFKLNAVQKQTQHLFEIKLCTNPN